MTGPGANSLTHYVFGDGGWEPAVCGFVPGDKKNGWAEKNLHTNALGQKIAYFGPRATCKGCRDAVPFWVVKTKDRRRGRTHVVKRPFSLKDNRSLCAKKPLKGWMSRNYYGPPTCEACADRMRRWVWFPFG